MKSTTPAPAGQVAQSDAPNDIKAACYRVDWSSDRPAGGLLMDAMKAEIADLRAALASRAPASGALSFDAAWDAIDWDKWRMQPIRELVRHIHALTSPAAAVAPAIPPQGDAEKLKGDKQ